MDRAPDALSLDEQELVVIGKIGASYGIQGWQHIISYSEPIENILRYPQWYVEVKDQWFVWQLKDGRRHGKGIVALLDKIETPEAAMQLRQSRIAVARDALETLAQDEFYWTDLEGMAVQTNKGEELGNIFYLYQNSNVDVMVVKSLNKERHIPFILHDTVLKVDIAHKRIIIDWDPAY